MIDAILIICIAVAPAIILHEVAHGWVAYMLGDSTAKSMGRLTLNPVKHIDLLGSIVVPGLLFLTHSQMMFGWAKPVPVNFAQLRYKRMGMILVAVAGPVTNIILAVAAVQMYKMHLLGQWNFVFGWAILFNLTLAVFNMVPIPPLDGSRIVTGFLPWKVAYYYNRLEPFGLFIIFGLLQFGMLRFLYPIVSHLGALMGVEL